MINFRGIRDPIPCLCRVLSHCLPLERCYQPKHTKFCLVLCPANKSPDKERNKDIIWASTWQNQQSDCAPSEDTDQPGHPLVRSESLLCAFFVRTAKTLIRLGGCPGWSESSLGAQSLCWFCHVAAHMQCLCEMSWEIKCLWKQIILSIWE